MTSGPLHFLFPLPGCIFPQVIYMVCFFSSCLSLIQMADPLYPLLLCFIFLSALYHPLTFDLLISWIVFCPLYDLEQGCPIEGSAIVEMFSICAVQHGPTNTCGCQHLNVASETEELDFELGWILINLNVSSCVRLMATILNSTGQFWSMIINPRNIYIIWISNLAFRNLSWGSFFLLKNVHCMV